jgi:hypothetical protein
MSCAHRLLNSALDRWQESHWHLHQVENNYHDADAFRYSMNSFIRAIREIPDIVSMELQNESGFPDWHRPIKNALEQDDELINQIIQHRNFIVHRAMLIPGSECHIATIRGRIVKMALPFPIDPFEDSKAALRRFLERTRDFPDILSILAPDEVQLIGVVRQWKIKGVKEEVVCAFRAAWKRMGKYLSEILVYLGGEALEYDDRPCFKDIQEIQQKKFPDINEQILKYCN